VIDTQNLATHSPPDQGGLLYVHFSTAQPMRDVYAGLSRAVKASSLKLSSVVSTEDWEYCWLRRVTVALYPLPYMTVATVSKATRDLLKSLQKSSKPYEITETAVVWQLPLPLDLNPL